MFEQNIFPLISILTLVVFFMAIIYLYRLYRKSKELEKRQERVYQEASKIIENAHKKSKTIIEETIEKAKETLFKTEYLKDDVKKDLENTFAKAAQKAEEMLAKDLRQFDGEYKNLFKDIKQEYLEAVGEALGSLEKTAQKEIEEFRKSLKKETIGSGSIINKKAEEEFLKAQKEVEEYKAKQLKFIDSSVNKIIVKVVKEATGKIVSISDHQEIILDSLNNAKRAGLFKEIEHS